MLANAPGFGAKTIHYIYKNLKINNLSVNDLFDLEPDELSRLFPEIGRGKFAKASFSCFLKLDSDDRLYSSFEKLKSDGITIIGLDDDIYPKCVLQNMADNAPSVLYCKGYLPILSKGGLSIVGARNVSNSEITITKRIAHEFAENGINVISGYAKGVDTSAHLGALEANGTTTMILSFGINYITIKRELEDLNWEKKSLFVTQFTPYEKFSGKNAMIRNKLVCAMSKAVVVIKSNPEKDNLGKMSGTFDAAKSAIKMGVPVFVLSPKLLQPTPQGNLDLIKLGGIEFTDAIDVVKFFEEYSEHEPVNVNSQSDTKPTSKTAKPYQTSLFNS